MSFHFVQHGLIATLNRSLCTGSGVVGDSKRKSRHSTIQELYELDSVSDCYLRSQYTILGSESLARRVIDHLGLDALGSSNSPKCVLAKEKKPRGEVFCTGRACQSRKSISGSSTV